MSWCCLLLVRCLRCCENCNAGVVFVPPQIASILSRFCPPRKREPPQPDVIALTSEEPGFLPREVLGRNKSRYDGLVDVVKLDDGSGRQFARKRTWTTEEFMWEAITEAYIMKLGEVVPAYVVQFQVAAPAWHGW